MAIPNFGLTTIIIRSGPQQDEVSRIEARAHGLVVDLEECSGGLAGEFKDAEKMLKAI